MFALVILFSWLMLAGSLCAAALWFFILRRQFDLVTLLVAVGCAGGPWLLAWLVGQADMIRALRVLIFESDSWAFSAAPIGAMVVDGALAVAILVQSFRAASGR